MNRDADEQEDRERVIRERDSSKDSKDSGREVRCGCQYFQSDSLLPERQSLVGTKPASRPSSRQSHHEACITHATMGDHEYEPVTPMANQPPAPTPPPVVTVTENLEEKPKVKKGRSSKIQYIDNDPNYIFIPLHGSTDEEQEVEVKQYLQIPRDADIIISQDVDADADGEDNNQDDQDDRDLDDEELSAHEMQTRMEERFFAPTPTTTESRTDCEFNTSQIDSSGLEDLPLKKEARKAADMSGKGFQQRIRSQAGRLRTKIRNIQKPKINLPDKSKFHLPERPKFKMPERPKFNLPERPKFKMPERPKMNLPERPKFNLPERPKFNMPQRPKISMPNFQLGKTKTSSLRRPLRDRNQLQSSGQSTAGSKKNIFDNLNFKTYPRFFNKKKRLEQNLKIGKRAMTPPPRMETDSIPSTPGSRKVSFGQKWTQRFKDIKFADDENRSNPSEKRSASLKAMSSFDDDEPIEDDSVAFQDPDFGAAFRDPDFGAATLIEQSKKKVQGKSANSLMDSDKEQRSSGSSSDRHRAGVLEEIDSDEFFLRQKGLSREDVDISRFLSTEIRDAFRSPKNALANLDAELCSDEDDEEICEVTRRAQQHQISHLKGNKEHEEMQPLEQDQEDDDNEECQEPIKPSRSRSLKSRRSTQSKTSLDTKEDNINYNTYPPTRPSRSRKQSMQSLIIDKQSIGTADLELEIKDGFTEDEARLDVRVPSLHSLDENDAGKLISGRESMNEVWPQETQPPLPPKRRKSTKDLSRDNDDLINESCPHDKWIDEVNLQAMIPGDVTALHMEPVVATVTPLQHGLYDSPPVAPIRKARSRGTSLADEDRTSRGAESLVSETQSYPVEDIPVEDTDTAKEDNFGYAIVEKPEHRTLEKPVRQKRNNKPPRPPPVSRKKQAATQMMNLKNQSIHFFFTYPRRAMKSLHRPLPVRPNRNYSTIGPSQTLPSRPPRRTKVFREPVYADDSIPFMDESEKETLDSSTPKIVTAEEITPKPKPEPIIKDEQQPEKKELSGSNDDTKDLQSGDVIEKMKGRPLPAPPRPSRKSKSDILLQNDEICKLESINNETNNTNEDEIIVTERINIQITPPKEIQEVTKIKTATTILNEGEKKVDEILAKQSPEIKRDPEKKEGPLTALKEMISQKKREFFEPKKETQTTIKTETVVTKVENKSDNGSLFKIIPLKSNEETETTVEETNVSTQTDPLPEGYIVEDEQQTEEWKQSIIKPPECMPLTSPHSTPKVSEQVVLKIKQPETEISQTPSISQSTMKSTSHQVLKSSQEITKPTQVTEVKAESTASISVAQTQPRQIQEIQTVIEKKVMVMPDPDTEVSFLKAQKLQVSELDVDKLNVSELQAKKISVSDIDGVAMQISELSSKSGNLVLNGVELPPEFLQNLVSTITSSSFASQSVPQQEQIQASTQTSPTTKESESVLEVQSTQQPSSQQSQGAPPVVVYPSQTPIIVYPPQTNPSGQSTISVHPAIIPQMYTPEYMPSKIPRTRSPPRNLPEDSSAQQGDSEEDRSSLMPVPAKRHHRHHHHHHHSHKQSPSHLSTDEEEEKSQTHNNQQQILQHQTAGQLIRQLMQLWQNSLQDGMHQVIDGINRVFPVGEKRKDAQTAACIILVLIAGLMIVGFGSSDKAVHHHHWDFQFPPPH